MRLPQIWTSLFVIMVTLVIFSQIGISKNSKKARHLNGLITPGYGIVTEDDLAYDTLRREIRPYNPRNPTASLYWQCLPVKDVKPRYTTSRDSDPMGSSHIIITMCSLEVIVRHQGELQIYGDRRGHPVDYCQDFVKEWRKLIKGEDIVCLNGEGGYYLNPEEPEKYKYWTWEKFKTSKGCFSYFAGQCNTAGCSNGKCAP